MSTALQDPRRGAGLSWGQIAFMSLLVTIGLGYLGWTFFRPAPKLAPVPERDVAQEASDYLRTRSVRPLFGPLLKHLENPERFLVKTQAHPLLDQPAPPFALPDHEGHSRRLQDALTRGPVVLVFYYGYYCNHCVSQLFALNADLDKFQELQAEIVAVSPDSPETTRARYRKYGTFDFPVLSDPGNKVAQAYGVFQPATDQKPEALQHGTFLIGQDGRIKWANLGDVPFANNRTLLYLLAKMQGRLPAATN
jgi:peroxiredoxin